MRLEEGRGVCAIEARMAVTGKMYSLLWCHVAVVSRCYLVVLPLTHQTCCYCTVFFLFYFLDSKYSLHAFFLGLCK